MGALRSATLNLLRIAARGPDIWRRLPEKCIVCFAPVRRPLALAFAGARRRSIRLALQISDNDPAKMNAVLNVAANVSKYYSEKGEEVEIQIVAFNAGLQHVARTTTRRCRRG